MADITAIILTRNEETHIRDCILSIRQIVSVAIISNIVLNMIMIPKYGIMGAAVATIIGHFLSGILFLVYFSKKSNISIDRLVIIQKEDFILLREMCRNATKKKHETE